jgi:hypothetical protein
LLYSILKPCLSIKRRTSALAAKIQNKKHLITRKREMVSNEIKSIQSIVKKNKNEGKLPGSFAP